MTSHVNNSAKTCSSNSIDEKICFAICAVDANKMIYNDFQPSPGQYEFIIFARTQSEFKQPRKRRIMRLELPSNFRADDVNVISSVNNKLGDDDRNNIYSYVAATWLLMVGWSLKEDYWLLIHHIICPLYVPIKLHASWGLIEFEDFFFWPGWIWLKLWHFHGKPHRQ